jgi:hypothetical protein
MTNTTRNKLLFIIAVLMQFFTLELQAQTIHYLKYTFNLEVEPSKNYLSGKLIVESPSDSIFYLADGLNVKVLKADGKKITYKMHKVSGNSSSISYVLPVLAQEVEIEYNGKINIDNLPKNICMVNRIDDRLIELSDYTDWYPVFRNSPGITYSLKLITPSGFMSILNGTKQAEKSNKSYCISVWKSENEVDRITFFAAPSMKKLQNKIPNGNIEVYYQQLPRTYADSMLRVLSKAYQLLTDIFGDDHQHKTVTLIYSPRPGSAYARAPLLLVSESYALEQRNNKYGFARDFRLNTHEIAHYWSKANTDNWICEGLAEYAALLVSDSLMGKDFSSILINEYESIIQNSPTKEAITETSNESSEREINWYYKPTLLLHELEKKFGRGSMFKFLKDLDSAFVKESGATTTVFLKVIEDSFGENVRDSFAEKLNSKGWKTEAKSYSFTYLAKDSVFLGTWDGILTQFGQSLKFILHVRLRNDLLELSLDSPDQNATGIPVSDVIINENVLSFKVGVAGADFKGILDARNKRINGTWTQRGSDYSIILEKE